MILAADCLWQSTASGPKIKIFLCFTRKDTPFIRDPFLFAEFCTNNKKKNGHLSCLFNGNEKDFCWCIAQEKRVLQGNNKTQS